MQHKHTNTKNENKTRKQENGEENTEIEVLLQTRVSRERTRISKERDNSKTVAIGPSTTIGPKARL